MNALAADNRSYEFWPVQPLYKGEDIFCLASGPSLTQAICDNIRHKRRIVVNSSCMLARDADVLFFTDSGWYEPRRDLVAGWPGHVMSMSRAAKRELPDKVKRIQGSGDPMFPPVFRPGAAFVQQGRTSGHTAVSLAISLGASRVFLLGFDMRVVNGREHHHSEYKGPRDLDQYARDFVPAFNGWNAAALKVGAQIWNCTPDSAVKEFPFADLDEVLACAR